MASLKYTLGNNYVQISSGPATIQKKTKGFGAVRIFFGTSAPTDDDNSFELDSNIPHFYPANDNIYARTPHDIPVDIIVGT